MTRGSGLNWSKLFLINKSKTIEIIVDLIQFEPRDFDKCDLKLV